MIDLLRDQLNEFQFLKHIMRKILQNSWFRFREIGFSSKIQISLDISDAEVR